ncbi:MAG TPA: undecaprenyl-phosphate glucose phosphotransferase [Vicinamibacterales bacterium]|nr:undecaprenyl-phosphate glucose phosphotransferase [Vicinamibacterales bacterium]HPW20774.1 undecaprenyl-phosphate glucose phosphotransferase [Vicinamibacterales bacterium]
MVRRYKRTLAAFFIVTDALLGAAAFLAAYLLRFSSGVIPITKGIPPFQQYLLVAPFVGLLVPVAYYFQGLYSLRRNRSRVDDFFTVFVGSIVAVVLGIVTTLYFQAYYMPDALKDRGAFEVSQIVWAIFLALNVAFTFLSRELVRQTLERRWRAGIGLKRILIVGAGELGRLVADKIIEHRELGYHIVGFVDDRAERDHLGYRGLPLLGTAAQTDEICQRENVDHIYIALPLEHHHRMLEVIEAAAKNLVDVKIVPDLLQFIALRARIEDMDGVPIINLNDVPLQGLSAMAKRTLDVACSAILLAVLALPLAAVALIIRLTSKGPVLYRQERMSLDGSPFTVYKFRSMYDDAEAATGPVWAGDADPRTTPVGRCLRRFDIDELPQLFNVLRGDMSLVGPRPERPYFVEQFKHRFPYYMLRHKVKSGITGWAQVNGWRGNTSIEKRIEFDLYYIENWSLSLDMKILWLTLVRGLGLFKQAPTQ